MPRALPFFRIREGCVAIGESLIVVVGIAWGPVSTEAAPSPTLLTVQRSAQGLCASAGALSSDDGGAILRLGVCALAQHPQILMNEHE